MELPELPELLTYKNEQVVRYCCHHHPDITYQHANELFTDLLAWLWLNAYRQNNGKRTYLFGSLLVLDEVWHAFILHTRDYYNFCQLFFIDYFHHDIEPIGIEHQLLPEEIEDFLKDSFDFLGEAWVMRYFSNLLNE